MNKMELNIETTWDEKEPWDIVCFSDSKSQCDKPAGQPRTQSAFQAAQLHSFQLVASGDMQHYWILILRKYAGYWNPIFIIVYSA